MSEVYTSDYLLDGMVEFIESQAEGHFDGFEIVFPQGTNTLDPLLMIRHGTIDADFESQVLITKAMIKGKPVKIVLFDEEVGSFTLNDDRGGFSGFPVFEDYPIALTFLIRTCFVSVLKNLVPPLSASQRAVMEARKKAKVASQVSQGEKSEQKA